MIALSRVRNVIFDIKLSIGGVNLLLESTCGFANKSNQGVSYTSINFKLIVLDLVQSPVSNFVLIASLLRKDCDGF